MTRSATGADPTGQTDRTPAGHGRRASGLVEWAVEQLERWLATPGQTEDEPEIAPVVHEPRMPPRVEVPIALASEAAELLAYLHAHGALERRRRRGGHKRRTGHVRCANAGPSVSRLTRAWARQSGRSERWARRRLDLLVATGRVRRERCGAGYAFRLNDGD